VKPLDALAQLEEQLVARVEALEGFLGERHVALERTGVPHEYAAVLTGYIDLFREPHSRLEALKRAMFLAWYALAEPGEFTGLWDITPVHQARVTAELEAELRDTGGDAELREMLAWYVRVMGGAPFGDDPACATLAAFIAASEEAEEPVPPWRPSCTAGRGQMGRYWASLRDDA
jgi:hypothetical protein